MESGEPQFTLEMLLITVSAGAVAALVLGFVTGYCCGRKCRKDDLGGEQLVGGRRRPLPLQDAEYEYFEQRGGLARPMLHAAPGDGSMFVAGGGGPGLGGVGVPLLHTNKLGAPLPEEVSVLSSQSPMNPYEYSYHLEVLSDEVKVWALAQSVVTSTKQLQFVGYT